MMLGFGLEECKEERNGKTMSTPKFKVGDRVIKNACKATVHAYDAIKRRYTLFFDKGQFTSPMFERPLHGYEESEFALLEEEEKKEAPIQAQKEYCDYYRYVPFADSAPNPRATVIDNGFGTPMPAPPPCIPPELKRWVATNYREWPYCGFQGKPVEIKLTTDWSSDKGYHYQGYFFCPGCSMKAASL